ncbi:MAG: hypothetical protein ABUT20_56110 [Bacteroidota bacterium]
MKSVAEKRPYFSAYPLKALNLPEEEYQSELKLWEHSNTGATSDLRVLPMVNPYRQKDFIQDTNEIKTDK